VKDVNNLSQAAAVLDSRSLKDSYKTVIRAVKTYIQVKTRYNLINSGVVYTYAVAGRAQDDLRGNKHAGYFERGQEHTTHQL
jgi:hypothetical protein